MRALLLGSRSVQGNDCVLPGSSSGKRQSLPRVQICSSKRKAFVAAALSMAILLSVTLYFGSYWEWSLMLGKKPKEGQPQAPKTWFEDANVVAQVCSVRPDPAIAELVALSAQYVKEGREPWLPSGSGLDTVEGEKEGSQTSWRGEEPVVKLIRSIVHPPLSRPSPYKYDVCMTTIVRNEYYLKEFLVSNILAGFQKIFLYDDSWGPGDTNIVNLIRPFVKAGVVEYSAQDRCERAKKARHWGTRDSWLQRVTEEHGKSCMWIMRLDSDEIVYPLGYPTQRLPEWLAGVEDKYCEVRLNWLFPYAGGPSRRRGFKLGETLLQAYPTMCFEHDHPKHLIQFNNVTGIGGSVHKTVFEDWYPYKCKSGLGVLEERLVWTDTNPEEPPRPLLLHYYTKSLEDFLVKKEQSLGPNWRQFSGYYDAGGSHCKLEKKPIPFAKEYVEDVVRVMSMQFTVDPDEDSAGETFERPVMTVEEAGEVEDYETYLFVKQQLREGRWFNQSCYYEKYPEVADFVKSGTFTDATFYFVSTGFSLGKLGCWEKGTEVFLYN